MAAIQTRKLQAIKIYNRVIAKTPDPKVARGKVLAELQAKLAMTAGGASTYYANMKNGNWALDVTPVKAKPAAKPVKAVKAKPALTVVPASKQAKVKPAKAAK